MALLNGGAKDKSRQNPFHYSHSVIQMSTYGVGDRRLMKLFKDRI